MLVTERAGRLRVIRNGVLDPQPVAGAPASYWTGESGLPGAVHGYMDIALHPQFAQNRLVYLSYTKPLDDKRTTVAVARGRFDGKALTEVKDVFVAGSSRHVAHRVRSRRQRSTSPQPAPTRRTRRIRRTPTRRAARCCVFATTAASRRTIRLSAKPDHRPEVYTLGHRSALGLAVHPGDRRDVAQRKRSQRRRRDQYPQARRQLRLADRELRPHSTPGRGSRRFPDTRGSSRRSCSGCRRLPSPAWRFTPATSFPKWKGDVFVGALRTGEIPGTGHLERILFNEKMEELRRESLLVELRQRIREVRQGPDGLLYLLTDEKEGAVLRIEPVQ